MKLTRRLRRAFVVRVPDGLCSVDNFLANPGTGGVTFASDDLGGSPAVHVPRVKIMMGADGSNEGDVSSEEPLPVYVATPAGTIGCSIFRSLDLDETEEDVKTSAGTVYGMWFTNTATSTRWLKFYNAAAASVTVGSTTPVLTIGLPGNTSDDVSGVFSQAQGIFFSTGICVAATTGVADADTGAPAANDVVVNIFFQ